MLLDQQMSDTQASQEQRRGQADQGPAHDEYRHPVFGGGIHCVLQLQGRLRQMEHECPAEDLFDHVSPAWLTHLAPPVGPGHDRIRDAPGSPGKGPSPPSGSVPRIAPELTTHHWGHRAPKEMRRR
ncbi:hypothetical protein San01_26710 [Streptomyces angustmyceticus]|uniref:Uncharacterized protein n=1 Tax=Streptomyces angustmyceticus TaxID=285578 RepID=A0A5J4LC47_9ACTN|nr:hypothetical protein San01_26710 [Streptomyces angustmyceticus]